MSCCGCWGSIWTFCQPPCPWQTDRHTHWQQQQQEALHSARELPLLGTTAVGQRMDELQARVRCSLCPPRLQVDRLPRRLHSRLCSASRTASCFCRLLVWRMQPGVQALLLPRLQKRKAPQAATAQLLPQGLQLRLLRLQEGAASLPPPLAPPLRLHRVMQAELQACQRLPTPPAAFQLLLPHPDLGQPGAATLAGASPCHLSMLLALLAVASPPMQRLPQLQLQQPLQLKRARKRCEPRSGRVREPWWQSSEAPAACTTCWSRTSVDLLNAAPWLQQWQRVACC